MDRTPQKIGPYRLERHLGRGGMGEVLLAEDERLGRTVALKRLHAEGASSPARRERLRREARATASLNHPSIVHVYDVVSDDSGDHVVMEHVVGETVADLLRDGPLPLAAAVEMGRQVADGLAHAHARGVVHRDLKAENVMITGEGRAKILDFGLAKALGADDASLTADGELLGTLRSMAPEQARGGEIDSRTDLFSFGVLLYESLSGRSPFAGATALDTLRRVVDEPPPPLPASAIGRSARLAALIDRLLAKQPDARPASAAEVVAELSTVHEELGTRSEASGDLASLLAREPSPERAARQAVHSEAPTGSLVATPAGPQPSSRPPSSRPWSSPTSPSPAAAARPTAVYEPPRPPRRLALAAAVAVLVAVTGLAGWWMTQGEELPRLRVAVAPTEAASPAGEETASAVHLALLDALASLPGLDVLEAGDDGEDAAAIARALATDEVVRAAVDCHSRSWCRVTLRRLGAEPGRVLATVGFEVPTFGAGALERARAVQVRVEEAYPERVAGPQERLAIDEEAYERYLALRRVVDSGGEVDEGTLEEIESVLEAAPSFPEGHRLATDVARYLRRPEVARRHLTALSALLPDDPRPYAERLRVELDHGDLEAATAALAGLERQAPGSIQAAGGRARLAAARGELDRAVELWQRVVDAEPSWINLWRLASAEIQAGRPEDARRHLGELLDRSPDNQSGLELLAYLESRSFDLARAEELYLRLLDRHPTRLRWTSLGWVQVLRGRYAAARDSYEKALVLEPDDRLARLNLAEVSMALGDEARAAELYDGLIAEISAHLDDDPPPGSDERLLLAQALAARGEARRAVELVEGALRERDEAQLRFQAAQVYAAIDDRVTALHHAERALDGGLRPEWLTTPGFRPLLGDPEFERLLDDARRSG
ncbi:MAG TPA: protein kinase [Thermoanaerobaculia bacterium]|nr:protein kinase [Thermoanaerobaculia bacterium]